MSWYSKIYTRVREIRASNPCLGLLLTFCLNALLFTQIAGIFFTTYVYIYIIVGYYVQFDIQAGIYLSVFFALEFMALWSLAKTIFTPVAKVPSRYRPPKLLDDKLRSVTPMENGRYVVEKSTPEQVSQQNEILAAMCTAMSITVAECDQVGRIKYCYECGHIKPDRTRHCSSCGHCSVKFDHHCPWINKCVGHANYKYFLLYVVYMECLTIWHLSTSFEGVVRYFVFQRWLDDLPYLLQILFTMLAGGVFSYYPIGELILFHWDMVSINETTCEQSKPAVLRFDQSADYNQGRMENIRQVFGWGLWFFPVYTFFDDGLHFKIRYMNEENKMQYIRTTTSQEDDDDTPITTVSEQPTSRPV